MKPSYLSSMSPTKEKNNSRRSSNEQSLAKLMYRQSTVFASGIEGFQRSSQSESLPENKGCLPNATPMNGFPYL